MKTIARLCAGFMMVVSLQACYGVAGAPAAGSVPAASPTSVSTATSSVTVLSGSVTTHYCTTTNRLGAFGLSDGLAFWKVFPHALDAPELQSTTIPLVAIAYTGKWPGHITGNSHQTGAASTDPPGTIDVCVETADGSYGIAEQPFIVYGQIPVADSMVATP